MSVAFSETGRAEFELDGDPFGEVIALRDTVEPLGLAVRVPPQ